MAINPFRKGGNDTVPITEGGTGGTDATTALANLGGISVASHALIDHSALGGGPPAGTVMDFAGVAAPSGWLECDGAAVSRTTYATLFTAISTAWGVGDGATTFNLPDLRRRTTVGRGGTGTGTLGNAVGNTGGAETHTLNTTEMPNHSHSDSGHSHTGFINPYNGTTDGTPGSSFVQMGGVNTGFGSIGTQTNNGFATIQAAGGSGAHNNMQPSAVMMKIIKT